MEVGHGQGGVGEREEGGTGDGAAGVGFLEDESGMARRGAPLAA